jgi:hypothetical protein
MGFVSSAPVFFGNPKKSQLIDLELTVSSVPATDADPFVFLHDDGRRAVWYSGGLRPEVLTEGARVKLACRVRAHRAAADGLPATTELGSVRCGLAG